MLNSIANEEYYSYYYLPNSLFNSKMSCGVNEIIVEGISRIACRKLGRWS